MPVGIYLLFLLCLLCETDLNLRSAMLHLLNPVYALWYVFCVFVWTVCTVMMPFGALG